MNTEIGNFAIATGGTFTVNGTAEVVKRFFGFYVAEDTVISSLKVGGVAVSLTDYIQTPATALKAGTIVSCQDDVFSAITLTSGSVTLILDR